MACDPDFADVTMLLHCDGINGSTVFTDLSSQGNTVTAQNGAQVDTSTFAFGTGSLAIDPAAGHYDVSGPADIIGLVSPITPSGDNDILTGGGDFTVEGWFNYSPVAAAEFDIQLRVFNYGAADGAGAGFVLNVNESAVGVDSASLGWSGMVVIGLTLPPGTWHHAAITRASGVATLWVDGVLQATSPWAGSGAAAPTTFTLGGDPLAIGGFGTGWIDEVRITKGLARYTANFTPDGPFGVSCTAVVPDLTGMTVEEATVALTNLGLLLGSITYAAGDTAQYTAFDQNPAPLAVVPNGSSVDITVSLPTVAAYGKFVGSSVFKAVEIANIGDIEPKIWRPVGSQTTRSRS